jgi:hypothetical protein
LYAALLTVGAGALAAVWYSAIDGHARLFFALLLLVHLCVLLRRCARSPGILVWRGETWCWIDRSAHELELNLQQATLWPGLMVLRFSEQDTQKTRVFVLLHDSVDSDTQRRLRMYLRHLPVFAKRDI